MEVAFAAYLSEYLPIENKVLGVVLVTALLSQFSWFAQKAMTFIGSFVHKAFDSDQGYRSRLVVNPKSKIYDTLVECVIDNAIDHLDVLKYDPEWSKPKRMTLLAMAPRKTIQIKDGDHIIDILLLDGKYQIVQNRPWNPLGLRSLLRDGLHNARSEEPDTKRETTIGSRPHLSFNCKTKSQKDLNKWLREFLTSQATYEQGFILHTLIREGTGNKSSRKPSNEKEEGTEEVSGHLTWKTRKMVGIKRFSNVPQPEPIRKALFEDVREFLQSKSVTLSRGQNWKRSYLLSGPPGCGKSSCIAAMAKEFDLEVFMFDMQAIQTNSEFVSAMNHVSDQAKGEHIIFFDDFDRCPLFKKDRWNDPVDPEPVDEEGYADILERSEQEGTSDPSLALVEMKKNNDVAPNPKGRRRYANVSMNRKISVDVLLQQLDGVSECHGRITIFAVNDATVLSTVDPTGALFREGRIDRHVRMTLATRSQATSLTRLFYGNDLPPMCDTFRNGIVSTAWIVNYLTSRVKNRDQAEAFLNGNVETELKTKLFKNPNETKKDSSEKPQEGSVVDKKKTTKPSIGDGEPLSQDLKRLVKGIEKLKRKRKVITDLLRESNKGEKARMNLLNHIDQVTTMSMKYHNELETKLEGVYYTEAALKDRFERQKERTANQKAKKIQ